METVSTERTQFTVRASRDLHFRLTEAAEHRGVSLNHFLLNAASKEADEILKNERVLNLGSNDSKLILDLLEKPPKPNAKLKKAFKHHRDLIDADS